MDSPLTVEVGATVAGEPRAARLRAFLVVYLGDAHSRIVELSEGVEVTFGRSRTATITVDDERVSRVHTRVTLRDGRIHVEDLGSRNGTRVGGVRIERAVVVTSGDEIVVGPAFAVVGIAGDGPTETALGGTSFLDDRLDAELDRSLRYHRPLALLMIRVEGEPAQRDVAIDRLAAALRRMDAIAEYAPDEYAVVAPELDHGAARTLAARLTSEIAAAGATARAGVAVFPDHAGTTGELVSQARASLRQARAGRTQTPPPVPSTSPDTIVADERSRRLYELVDKVAPSGLTVLILGETGTGKELVAEALHRRSPRARGPLIRLNCASLPETLLESELFGHEKGAFTGAERRKVGFIEAADGGTLFLDEIGEMPASLQPKLLRVLEQRIVTRVGGTAEVPVDVRLIAATHRNLEHEVRTGGFREDLYFRISTFTLAVPPLRDRPADIGPLVEHFIRGFAGEQAPVIPTITAATRELLLAYPWPGNVRELRNAIERAMVMQSGGIIDVEHLPERVRGGGGGGRGALVPVGDALGMRDQLADVERAAIVSALESTGGNQTHAASRLGLSRRALIYKLEKYGLKAPPGRR